MHSDFDLKEKVKDHKQPMTFSIKYVSLMNLSLQLNSAASFEVLSSTVAALYPLPEMIPVPEGNQQMFSGTHR